MSQPREYLTFLTDADGRSYRVKNGLVETTSVPTRLGVSPDGLRDTAIVYQRNATYYGLFRSYTTPLKFIKSGARIVRERLYKYGTEDRIYLLIHRLAKAFSGGWVHKLFYKGELDLSQSKDSDTHIEVNVMEGDLVKLLKANEKTLYEFDLDDARAIWVQLDGIRLLQKANFIVTNGLLDNDLGGHIIAVDFIGGEAIESIGAVGEERVKTGNTISKLWGTGAYFVQTGDEDTDLTIDWDFMMYPSLDGVGSIPNTTIFFQLWTLQSDSAGQFNQLQGVGGGDPLLLYDQWQHFSGSTTITVPANSRCVLYMTANQNRDFTLFTYGAEGYVNVQYTYRHPTTYVKAFRPADLGQMLLDKMTGGGYTFSSNYLSSPAYWKGLVVTSGDGVRGLDGAKLRTTFADFFESYDVPCNLCLKISGATLSMEKKEEAFGATVAKDFGEVKNLKVNTAKNYQYNTVKIGYPDSNTEALNGKDEFNVSQVYSSPVTRISKELNLVSKYRASMYEIEIARINLDGKTTTDDQNDKEVYFLHTSTIAINNLLGNPQHYYKLIRPEFTSITGLLFPETAFNVMISPKHCLLNHGNYLRSLFYWLESGKLAFQSSDKNAELKTVLSGVTVDEKADVVIGSLAAPLFIPLTFEFDSAIPDDMIDIMDATPADTFAFEYEGLTYYGFAEEINIKPVGRPPQQTTLLCSPVTDLTQLING